MNNYEAVVACLRRQREGRAWTDEGVASEVLAQLGVDPLGEAKDATPAPADEAAADGPALVISSDPLDMAPGTLDPARPALVPAPAAPAAPEPEPVAVDPPADDDSKPGKASTRSAFSTATTSDDDSKDSKRK